MEKIKVNQKKRNGIQSPENDEYFDEIFSSEEETSERERGSPIPEDYVDPEKKYDRLPQPFRMIEKILNQILEEIWKEIGKKQEQRRQEILSNRKKEENILQAILIDENQIGKNMGNITAIWTSRNGEYQFMGTIGGRLMVFGRLFQDGAFAEIETNGGKTEKNCIVKIKGVEVPESNYYFLLLIYEGKSSPKLASFHPDTMKLSILYTFPDFAQKITG
eukprot:Sdes_comp9737_c0_seq1m1246